VEVVTIGGLRVSQFGQLVDSRPAIHFEIGMSALTQIKVCLGYQLEFLKKNNFDN
jgi:hypothetical protein